MSQTQQQFIPVLSNQLGGAVTVNIFALLSALALASVLLRAAWLAIRLIWFNNSPTQVQEVVFFQTQLGSYASCLIIGLMLNSVAGIIGFQWLLQRGVTDGWPCRIQALFMQLGNFSVGYFTLAIAVHTFNSLVLKMRQSVIICRTTIVLGWLLTGLVASAPFMIHSSLGYVYGAAPLGCGVRAVYPTLMFIFHLLPILLASFLAAILYSLIFLVLRGSLKLKSGVKLTLDPTHRWHASEGMAESYHRFIARVARSMLWYPIAYIALLIPYAVTRLFMIAGFAVPFQAIVFASVCWYSLSVVDVLLLYNTFRVLGPAFDACSAVSTRKSMGSIGNFEKYAPTTSPEYITDIKEKIHQYRSESVSTIHSGSNSISDSSVRSGRPLLPLHHARDDSFSAHSTLGRNITTYDNQQWEIAQPPSVPSSSHLNRQMSMHSRMESGSSTSSGGLPAPPRQLRSTLLTLPEPSRPARGPNDGMETDKWLNHKTSTQTFGHQRSPSSSIYSEDGTTSPQWTSRSMHHNLIRQISSGQVAVNFISPNIPTQVFQTSPPASATLERGTNLSPSSIARYPRPLLLSHAARSSSVDNTSSNFQLPPHPAGYF
ncbi:hypothetical protein BDN70DRAFT_888629 [Pholiota conissans]|uniref:G-protein coupled receptors family 1 profile domain-containing protein n=1 Tax=Pholiota conissans TaxID=109636 RepID=A0A9P5YKF0_9AGAR|nr:hypothetical protein BDN70DRAFT_888629 [Pholiota conissans]